MRYDWKLESMSDEFDLRLLNIEFKVLNFEQYEDQDYPDKENFKHPWRAWKGVKIEYKVGNKIINGHRGKTVWYIPAESEDSANLLNIEVGQALKIVKYPVLKNPKEEYHRLLSEFAIQKTLFDNNLASNIHEIVLVKNNLSNKVQWFDDLYCHDEGTVYFAQIVEHLETKAIPDSVNVDNDYYFMGEPIEELRNKCDSIGIKHYDLSLGNVFCDKNGNMKVVDTHKWQWKYDLVVPQNPEYLQIELNNSCNAKCGMCAIPKMKRKKGYMNDELFERILMDAKNNNIKNIIPFLHGEPFLRDDYIAKLKLINKILPEANITIFTNASKLTKKVVDQLKSVKNIDRINFSFPGGNKDVYESVTNLDYDQVVNNIKNACNTLACKITITMPKFIENASTEEEFKRLWSSYNAHVYDSYHYIDMKVDSEMQITYTPCDRILRSMTVLWDGTVNICCLDSEGKYRLGDLKDQEIQDVWHSNVVKEYREKHIINRNYCEPCYKCNQILLPPRVKV